jgi:hypothetical protein
VNKGQDEFRRACRKSCRTHDRDGGNAMKKLLLLLLLSALTQTAYAQDQPAPAGNPGFLLISAYGGLAAPIRMKTDDTEHVGLLTGLSLKYLYDDVDYPAVGAGYTYFSSVFKDDNLTPGTAKARMSGYTVDIMIAVKRTYTYITYVVVCAGKGQEKFYTTSTTSPPTSWKTDTQLMGIGFGAIEKPTADRRLIFGSEIRYLSTPDLDNVSGIVQVLVSMGYAF